MANVHVPKPESFTLALHAELRAWMGRRGLSFRQLAEASEISRNKIHRTVSTDQAALSTDEFDRVCKALQVTPKDIVDAAERLLQQQGHYLATNYDLQTQDGYTLAAKEVHTGEGEDGVEYYEG